MWIKAILFDMDGLLVDTETLGIEVAKVICGNLNIKLSTEEEKSFIWITDEEFYKQLFIKRNEKFDVQKTLNKHFELYESFLYTRLKPFPGAETLPKTLKQNGYRLGLVSGSTRKQIDIILYSLKIKQFFDVIVSCDDITNSKPNPEGYLLAAKKLNIDSEECLVLEDTETWIKAAKSAKMKVIGVHNNGNQNLDKADITIENLTRFDDLKLLGYGHSPF